jgi:hypothetical protein
MLLWYQYPINNVNHPVCALYIRVYHFSVIYLDASVKKSMNFYLEGLAPDRR